jgi:hypothetical protein
MRILRIGSTLALVTVLAAASPRGAAAQSPTEIVIQWNQILQATLLIPGAQPPTIFFPRPYAVLHLAMYEAVNSIDLTYREYAFRATPVGSPAREVAAAQAARDVMVDMYPAQRATFDAALAATLARFPGDPGIQGARVGAAAAQAILDLRRGDGWERPNPPYILPNLPGYWQPTPPNNPTAGFVHYQDVKPFVLSSRTQFLPEAPPALTSALYAADFNEVKAFGGATSTVRTADQALTARLFASVNYSTSAPGVWYQVAATLARARGLNGLDTARMFALLAMTMHDALMTSMTSKFMYGLWRPVTAIREAARDGNAATEPDPAWLPLVTTPPYPSYAGNMACIGSSSAAVFGAVFGRDDIPFSVTWVGVGQDNVTRNYGGFRHLGDEATQSRIYGGIHFRFDHVVSYGVCPKVADYTVSNYLRRR